MYTENCLCIFIQTGAQFQGRSRIIFSYREFDILEIKTDHMKRRQKYIKKRSDFVFTCILPSYVAHEPPKEF